MDLRQLAALVAVADHRSFSAAARSLHTVQSNVSTHVAHLERELGVTLFDRSAGVLTEEGHMVAGRARRIQAEIESLCADVASSRDLVSGNVRLGVIGTTGRWLVSRLLDALGAAHPRIHPVVVDATTTSLLPQLEGGRLDLAVVALPIDDPDVATEPLFDEDLLVVAPKTHPLAEHGRVTLAELATHDLLLEPPGTAFRDGLDAAAKQAGVGLRARAEVDGMRLVASLAIEGYGAAVLPATAVPGWMAGDWRRVTVDDLAPRSVGLARRRRALLSAPARALRDVLRTVVAEQAPRHPGVHLTLED